jgi:hypothetical protein
LAALGVGLVEMMKDRRYFRVRRCGGERPARDSVSELVIEAAI